MLPDKIIHDEVSRIGSEAFRVKLPENADACAET
jgi:hypothetical protein